MKPDVYNKLHQKNPHKIKELRLENARLNEAPEELIQFTRLKLLSLFNNRLHKLPNFIKTLKSINHLNLSNNKFIIFPDEISNLENLSKLNLKGNRLTSITGIENLSNTLEKLNLSSNKLEVLRTDFSSFSKLRDIDLSQNNIQKFPRSLMLPGLRVLNLSSNRISKIPIEILKLTSLTSLDLSYNNITELPEEISELQNLRSLNLTGNQLLTLPKSFSKLQKLQKLNLNGNPIGDAPIEISNQGLDAVLNYYLHIGDSVKLNEAKLLLVGHGGVGKTFLLNRLVNNNIPETSTTEGIDIIKWNLQIKNNGENQRMRLNVWDFGGQEIYHSTHQFFLTKRSLYLFVWEARKDESLITFDYWLNIIQILSNSSPVIIVLNKIDERVKEIDRKSLKEKFPNIKAFESVSAKDGQNIEMLITSIKESIVSLPHIGDKLPRVWSQIREELENLTDNYISYNQYIEICNKYGLDKKEAKHLSNYFHDLGVFLHFSDNQILRFVVFLKPEWATNIVYKILDLKEVITSFGVFNNELLEEKLSDYTEKQIFYIIEMMKKFEICFELENNKYIIPELLKPSHPDFSFIDTDSISFVYKYDFMPAGILPRLIIRLSNIIVDNNYWKNGVFIQKERAKGEVESNQFNRTIKIKISGENKALLLTIIKHELDDINRTLNNPYHEMKIQCNCKVCSVSDNPFMFHYEYLERAKIAQVKTVRCEHNIVDIDLSELIGPYEVSSTNYQEDFRFNEVDLTADIVEVSTRIMERKYGHKIEDLITDYFTDNLRSKGYNITDQTRSGKALKLVGELDIMIRNTRSMPVSILEAFKLSSFGPGNSTVINHLNKLLINYDTNGLKRNFLLVYAKTQDFPDFWRKYKKYIEDLPDHHLYRPEAKLVGFIENRDLSSRSNLKIISSQHERNKSIVEIYHIIINMD